MTSKNGSGKCSLFVLSKNMDSLFSLMHVETALFDWPIVFKYDVKSKYRLISGKFSGRKFFSPEHSLNQPKATSVCILSTNQSYRSISVRLLFLFCSRVFTLRSYKNRSKKTVNVYTADVTHLKGDVTLFAIFCREIKQSPRLN